MFGIHLDSQPCGNGRLLYGKASEQIMVLEGVVKFVAGVQVATPCLKFVARFDADQR